MGHLMREEPSDGLWPMVLNEEIVGREQDDDAAVLEIALAMLGQHGPRAHAEELVRTFECWIRLGEGLRL